MLRLAFGLSLFLFSALVLAPPESATGCAVVRSRLRPGVVAPPRLEVAEESALIFWDAANQTEHFIRRASFTTDVKDFGFLVPTPTQPQLAEAADSAFTFLERETAPPVRIVYSSKHHHGASSARGKGRSPSYGPTAPPPVTVLETKRVAGFDAAVLEATDAAALNGWFKKHGYQARPELVDWLEPYIKRGWKITAFKIAGEEGKNVSLQTSAVRMSFKTDRPFFPYREPADQRGSDNSVNQRRLLRVYFLSNERIEGRVGKDGAWPGKAVYAQKILRSKQAEVLELLKLDKLPLSELTWLTEFEDRAAPRPGIDDVFFSSAPDQSEFTRPAVIRYVYRPRPAKKPKTTPDDGD